MSKIDYQKISINLEKLEALFLNLSDRDHQIIRSRYGISSDKETLSTIGQKFGLSRERIRQLEAEAKKRLRIIFLNQAGEEVKRINQEIDENCGIITLEEIKNVYQGNDSKLSNLLIFFLDTEPTLDFLKNHPQIKRGWMRKNPAKNELSKMISKITAYLEKNGISTFNQIQSVITDPTINRYKLKTCIDAAREVISVNQSQIGLLSDRNLNPKTIADKIHFILINTGKPLHFSKIADLIVEYNLNGKKANSSTIHNELIANKNYVLIGRGIYALKKWGYKEGTIEELIVEYLEQQGQPVATKKVVEFISRQRVVKRNTILVNLTKSEKIAKNKEGEYYIKNGDKKQKFTENR
jgi:DNA-directed RNA polymerase delta subunit